jgi:hypothetical protein
MGNAVPKNIVGTVENFTEQEFTDYEIKCRPGGGGVNDRHSFLGISYGSDEGFIDANESLKDVALRDHQRVVELLGPHGHEMIALRMSQTLSDSNDEYIATIVPELPNIRGHIVVEKIEYLGNQGCPFWKEIMFKKYDDKNEEASLSECGGAGGVDFIVTNKKNNETIKFSALMPHMIFYHHFYEGNVPNRVDPEKLIKLFEIEPKLFANAKWDVIARDEKGVFVSRRK